MDGFARFLSRVLIVFSCLGSFQNGANALTFEIVADNDYALFSGTGSSINTLLYQNDYEWPSQGEVTIGDPPSGDTYYYLLAMGGGGLEEIFGTIGGRRLTSISGVKVSGDVSSLLKDENLGDYYNYADLVSFAYVENGYFSASLESVQSAFNDVSAGSGFSDPNLGCFVVCGLRSDLSGGENFVFADSTAVLFSIPMSDPAPVPAPLPALGAAAAFGAIRRRRAALRLRQASASRAASRR